jgi:hypothetical protein
MGVPRTRLRKRLAAAAGALIATLVAAPAAQALSPPEVFLQEEDPSNQPVGNWIPLSGASMHSVNRYLIGVRIQDTGQPGNTQRINARVDSVPSGSPTQPDVYSNICPEVTGAAGQIVPASQNGPEDVRYQGDGTYSISVTATPAASGDIGTNCGSGPATTGTFTAAAPTGVQFVGHMVTADPNPKDPFGGILVSPAFGAGGTDIICARDPRPAPDGTLTGSLIVDQGGNGYETPHWTMHAGNLFEQPGSYACVARSVGGGEQPGPWSAPTPTEDVQTGFYPQLRTWRLFNSHGPVFKLTGRITSPLSARGSLSVVIKRSDKHERVVRLRTRVGAGGAVSLRFRLPPSTYVAYPPTFVMSFSFGGTRWVAARPLFGVFGLSLFPQQVGNQLQFVGGCHPLRC